MKYLQHKQTGEIILSLENLRELIDDEGQMNVLTEVVIPNKWLGNGVISHLMSYPYIQKNYKRISKKKALILCPCVAQWRHIDDENNESVRRRFLHDYSILKEKRPDGFGISFKKTQFVHTSLN